MQAANTFTNNPIFLQTDEQEMISKRHRVKIKINGGHFKPVCKHCAGVVLIGKVKRRAHALLKRRVAEELRRNNMKLIYPFETSLYKELVAVRADDKVKTSEMTTSDNREFSSSHKKKRIIAAT